MILAWIKHAVLFDLMILGRPVPVLQNDTDGESTPWYIVKAMFVLLIKLWNVIQDFSTRQVRRPVHSPPYAMQAQAQRSPSPAVNQPVARQTTELNVDPCLERLDRLESIFNQLMNKPPEIPREKDRVLLESFDRIKCIEHDLDKTKKVSLGVLFLIKFYNITNSSAPSMPFDGELMNSSVVLSYAFVCRDYVFLDNMPAERILPFLFSVSYACLLTDVLATFLCCWSLDVLPFCLCRFCMQQ